ncbi:MAG: 4-hydroxy-tetrahydrodipicolinate reductase [Solobacterium sp.]|nr:4-hydroxy-tetrahydrodipicolinate reductase [Solobacterium sp.]
MKILIGGKGKMGRLIRQTAQDRGHQVISMVDALNLSVLDMAEKADMIIDFSHPANLDWICDYVEENNCSLVYGTTGLTDEQKEKLYKLAENHPVFYSANFSYGVAVLQKLLATAVPLLEKTFDMELIETHHNQKVDAPSGTAKAMLAVMDPDNNYTKVYGREGITGARGKEIGVHSLRGGTEAGEHTVIFFGNNESITITHHADNRQIFVDGAMRAAEFLFGRPAGMYTMNDLMKG